MPVTREKTIIPSSGGDVSRFQSQMPKSVIKTFRKSNYARYVKFHDQILQYLVPVNQETIFLPYLAGMFFVGIPKCPKKWIKTFDIETKFIA